MRTYIILTTLLIFIVGCQKPDISTNNHHPAPTYDTLHGPLAKHFFSGIVVRTAPPTYTSDTINLNDISYEITIVHEKPSEEYILFLYLSEDLRNRLYTNYDSVTSAKKNYLYFTNDSSSNERINITFNQDSKRITSYTRHSNTSGSNNSPYQTIYYYYEK